MEFAFKTEIEKHTIIHNREKNYLKLYYLTIHVVGFIIAGGMFLFVLTVDTSV